MPSLQYVQTNNDPSVGEALHGVAQTLNNAKEIALTHQLLQLRVQKEMTDLQSAGLAQQINQQSLMEHKALWDTGIPLDKAQAELEKMQAEPDLTRAQTGQAQSGADYQSQEAARIGIGNQYAGPLAQLQLNQGGQSLQQQTLQTAAMPDQLTLQSNLGQQQLQQSEHLTDVSMIKRSEAIRDYILDLDARKGWGEVAAKVAEATMPGGEVLGKQIKLYAPMWGDKMREGIVQMFHNSGQLTEEGIRSKILADSAAARTQQINQSSQAMLDKMIASTDPNNAKQVDAVTEMYYTQHGGRLQKVEIPGTAATFMQPTQGIDRSPIENLKPAILELIKRTRAERAKAGSTTQPTQGQDQTDQQDQTQTQSGDGSSKDRPIGLKPTDDWMKHKAHTWIQYPGQPAMEVPPH